jgi:hypothetical protein
MGRPDLLPEIARGFGSTVRFLSPFSRLPAWSNSADLFSRFQPEVPARSVSIAQLSAPPYRVVPASLFSTAHLHAQTTPNPQTVFHGTAVVNLTRSAILWIARNPSALSCGSGGYLSTSGTLSPPKAKRSRRWQLCQSHSELIPTGSPRSFRITPLPLLPTTRSSSSPSTCLCHPAHPLNMPQTLSTPSSTMISEVSQGGHKNRSRSIDLSRAVPEGGELGSQLVFTLFSSSVSCMFDWRTLMQTLSLIYSPSIPPVLAQQPDHLDFLHLCLPAQLKPRPRQPPHKTCL